MPINLILGETGLQSMQPSRNPSRQQAIQSKITSFLASRGASKPKAPTTPPPQGHQLTVPAQQQQRGQSPHSNPSRSRSPTESLSSSLSALSRSPLLPNKSPPALQSKPSEKEHLNVEFYLNKMPSRPNGEFISRMLSEWRTDYERLERDHSFIQWLFPNSFQSRFNSHARPLSLEEAEIFKGSLEMLQRYVSSYVMILGFFGMRLRSKATGELVRSRAPDFKERFHKTLLTSFHNHMRVTRILCSLSELGFGAYATELTRFLRAEIYGPDGALRPLQKYKVYEQWKPFERAGEDQKDGNLYMARLRKEAKQPQAEKPEPIKEGKQKEEGEGKREPLGGETAREA